MTAEELGALIAEYHDSSTHADIAASRRALMDGYLAEPYGDEIEDRSRYVATDISDTVESILPELMDIFFGGDKTVMFAPQGPEDVEAAEQETDVCNHVIAKNDGFITFYTWFKDALTVRNGYVKRYWDVREVTEIEEYDELTATEQAQVLSAISGDEVEFLEQWDNSDDPDAQERLTGFKLRVTRALREYRIEPVAPDEIRVHSRWHKISLDGCPFVAHCRDVPVSDLIEMGFDRAQLEAIADHGGTTDEDDRFGQAGAAEGDAAVHDDAMRPVLVCENYVRADYDGDGVAELLQVWTTEDGKILKWDGGEDAIEPVDGNPFNALTPLPIPHKHYGRALSDIVQDLQRLRSVLVRHLVDGINGSNNGDLVVDEDQATSTTLADLKLTQVGRVIRVPGGAASVQPLPSSFNPMANLSAIEYLDRVKSERTGTTPYQQGLDADSLNKTASGIKQIITQSQKRILLIARIFAETGVKGLFLDMHRDLRKGPVRRLALDLRGKWVSVSPRVWRNRSDMSVNVGLGTGNKEGQLQSLFAVLAQQKEAMAAGLLEYKHLHVTLKKITELAGFRDADKFFPVPEEIQPPAPQGPDQNAQLLAQIEMQKAQVMMQKAQMDMQSREMAEQTRRLDVMMRDDRERDLAAAKIEADEAARNTAAVDGKALAHAAK